MKIYTKRGDAGETGLLYGGRVSKTDPRCAAYGTVDEAVSALGLARAASGDLWVRARLLAIQRDLFVVGGELATDREQRHHLEEHFSTVTSAMVDRLESSIDEIDEQIELPGSFIIPGASQASAAVDLARSIVRRAEREVIGLVQNGLLDNPEVPRYLNRLSDLLFMLARFEDRAMPFERLTGGCVAPDAGGAR